MGESSRAINLEEDIKTYCDNLIGFLEEVKDFNDLKNFLRHAETLLSQCDKDFNVTQKSIEDYEMKIQACKQKAAAAQSESASDAELDLLQKELEDEQNLERMLREEIKVANEISDLESKLQTIRKSDKDEPRAWAILSMCASVTKTIPYFDDPSSIAGHIVDRDKNAVKMFEFDPSKVNSFDTCDNIWKMVNLS